MDRGRLHSTPDRTADGRPCRILIVDDHPLVRAGLQAVIAGEDGMEVCGVAESVSSALQAVEALHPDVVLVDLSLEGSSGLELLKHLHGRPLALLVVSVHRDPTWAERALAAGALGYVHKGEAAAVVADAIRSVHAGRPWVSPDISSRLLVEMVGARPREEPASLIKVLSDRELEVFERIGRGLSTGQIAESLCLSPKTVQTHRENLKAKLGIRTAAELASRATRWFLEHSARG